MIISKATPIVISLMLASSIAQSQNIQTSGDQVFYYVNQVKMTCESVNEKRRRVSPNKPKSAMKAPVSAYINWDDRSIVKFKFHPETDELILVTPKMYNFKSDCLASIKD